MNLPPELFEQALRLTPAAMTLLSPDGLARFANPAFERLTCRPLPELLDGDPLEHVHPEDRERLRQRLRQRTEDPRVRTAIRWLTAEGAVCDTECLTLPVTVQGEPWSLLVALDVTPARKLAYRTASLERFSSALALARTLPEALDALARSVVEATGAGACAVFGLARPAAPGEGVPTITTIGTCNIPPEWARTMEALWRSGEPLPPRQALATGRTVVAEPPAEGPIRTVAEALGVQMVASVPMRIGGVIMGLITCLYDRREHVDEAELTFIETLAPLAAVVVANARLFERVRETAITEERQHLARELHDSVSQALYGIGLGARTALKLLPTDPARAAEPMEYVLSLAESGLSEMRALLFELRPESLERDGLVGALQARARVLESRHRLVVDLEAAEEPDIPLEARHGLFRIAAEATHNVVKHAEASRVKLRLQSHESELRLEIEDDGCGFAVDGVPPTRLGLRSMRERAEFLGGRLEVRSREGAGTTVVATLPREEPRAPSRS